MKTTTTTIYRNKYNENKYISVKHWKDGHYGVMQFMKWGNIVNPLGCSIRSKGKHFRFNKHEVLQLLEDYKFLKTL